MQRDIVSRARSNFLPLLPHRSMVEGGIVGVESALHLVPEHKGSARAADAPCEDGKGRDEGHEQLGSRRQEQHSVPVPLEQGHQWSEVPLVLRCTAKACRSRLCQAVGRAYAHAEQAGG